MIKIYIIEDAEDDFTNISNDLERNFGNAVTILPKKDIKEASFLKWSKVMDYITEQVSSSVPTETWMDQLYSDLKAENINYFIIDNCLLPGDIDDTGIEIVKYLHSKGWHSGQLVLFTKDSFSKEIKKAESICTIITKHTDKNISIVKYLQKMENLNYLNPFSISVTEFSIQIKRFIENSITFVLRTITIFALGLGIWLTFISAKRKLYEGVYLQWYDTSVQFERAKNILSSDSSDSKADISHSDFVTIPKGSSGSIQDNRSEKNLLSKHEKQTGMFLLQFIEDLFLNFLPFFIVFGFLGYYNNYLRFIWVRANATKLQTKPSIFSLKISKSLFISSIIATLIINVLERLIDPASFSDRDLYIKLIPHFILIIILCVYFFQLEKEENDERPR